MLGGEPLASGDWVLVHAGFALSKIDEDEARETLALLQEMSDVFTGDPEAETVGIAEGTGLTPEVRG